eukprot:CAMPEP_0171735578 /NCGR_PEP_ID=MMETSP0991-20121206/31673_1 /TAXON_ID=483369 /ORGANISM="non described non described, Strain CCMP2098" /LENGTH=45 /DNA_ID= /DNA_START= /DNA_END= /DNA_ORIENTATION=
MEHDRHKPSEKPLARAWDEAMVQAKARLSAVGLVAASVPELAWVW